MRDTKLDFNEHIDNKKTNKTISLIKTFLDLITIMQIKYMTNHYMFLSKGRLKCANIMESSR